jgi:hypothetical protein
MRKFLGAFIGLLLFSAPALAQNVQIPPSSVGVAAPGQVPATATNDNAAAGKVGEFGSSSIASGSAVSLSGLTTVTTISLAPGDYDVQATCVFTGAAATTVTDTSCNVTSGSAGAGVRGTNRATQVYTGTAIFATDDPTLMTPLFRISLASTTTVYMNAQASFAVDVASVYGTLRWRRVR